MSTKTTQFCTFERYYDIKMPQLIKLRRFFKF